MRAPNPPRSVDKIVSTILEACQQEAKIRNLELDSETESEIHHSILALQAIKGNDPALGYWVDNKEWAQKLQKWVADGDELFAKMPISFRWRLFDDLYEASIRLPRFLAALGWFGRRCAAILETKAGAERPRTEPEKQQSAIAARYIMGYCGLPVVYTDEGGLYRRIASLLHEAITGALELDLRHQCEAIAKLPHEDWDEMRKRFYLLINYAVSKDASKDNDGALDEAPDFISSGD